MTASQQQRHDLAEQRRYLVSSFTCDATQFKRDRVAGWTGTGVDEYEYDITCHMGSSISITLRGTRLHPSMTPIVVPAGLVARLGTPNFPHPPHPGAPPFGVLTRVEEQEYLSRRAAYHSPAHDDCDVWSSMQPECNFDTPARQEGKIPLCTMSHIIG